MLATRVVVDNNCGLSTHPTGANLRSIKSTHAPGQLAMGRFQQSYHHLENIYHTISSSWSIHDI
jgi:hypothetical protein